MSDRRKPYPFDEIEPRWQACWENEEAFRMSNPGEPGFDSAKPKYYILDMFPYPSGQGLHVGHTEGYTATDIIARQKRLRGFNVLHPMGWDAFGLPAEQYAIKTGQHPRITTETNINRFREQLKRVGFSYDWSREVNTTDPGYFHWTQWIFLKLYNSWFDPSKGKARPIAELEAERVATHPDESEGDRRSFLDSRRLAYVTEMPVNWCPALGTVLANEEVIDGKSEVGGHPVERRPMRQWMLRITDYAERLIAELDLVDWPESIKLLQRNWIGRSEGASVRFTLKKKGAGSVEVFTTRPDTLFGATYMVLAPEHPLVDKIATPKQKPAIAAYREKIASKSDLERTDLAKEKSGVFTGAKANNPVNGEEIPVWIADYVLMSYGTGAIMAVPGHDERDFEFATLFGLPIRRVVDSAPGNGEPLPFTSEGVAVDSGFLSGKPTAEAKRLMTDWLAANGHGEGRVNYKLRDWLFSRQRYWGEPFPILWRDGHHEAISESDLPLVPPDLEDFLPTGTGEPPLAKATAWVETKDGARRETNTMPQWAGSCWYYLRYCDPKNPTAPIAPEVEKYWMNVDLYVGGTEHAVLHLLYARFWHKVLFDLGHVSTPEPFHKLINQGIILGEDGQKMAKSRGNVVSPDSVIESHGADALRLYEMFMGPLKDMKPWSTSGVEGVSRFLARVWRLVMEETQEGSWAINKHLAETEPTRGELRVLHATIKKVSEDIDDLAFNTAISQMMICTNELTAANPRSVAAVRTLLILLNPFAPHLTEELWAELAKAFPGGPERILAASWPVWNPELLIDDEIEIVVQINCKVREKLVVPKDATKEQMEQAALALPKITEAIAGTTPKKIIAVPGRLVNIVL